MNRKNTRAARIFIIFAMILALVVCASAQADTYEANTMRLLHYQGNVEIFNPSGESRFVMENVRFSSGESMKTGEDSLASIELDDNKIVTMDTQSRVEFIQEANHFRLNLLEGSILLDVKEKLDENESLDIQTSTMTIGIRGTVVFVSEQVAKDAQSSVTRLGVLEGTAQIDYTDQSGAHRLMPVPAGQLVTVEGTAESGYGVVPVMGDLTNQDLEAFVTGQVLSDADLAQRVIKGSDAGEVILLPKNPSQEEAIAQETTSGFAADGDWTWTGNVTLVAQSASKLFDGQPLSRPTDVLVYGLPEGFNIRVSARGTQINAGEGINDIGEYRIYNSVGEDVTSHFTNIDKVSGKLTVDPAPLIVWTGSAEKYYDGEPLTNPEAQLRTVPGHQAAEPDWRNTSIVTRTALGSETMVSVSGSTWVHSTNPVTGETREVVLFTGQRLSVRLNGEGGEDSIEFEVETLTVDELPEDILRLYAANPDLMAQACEDAGWDPELLEKRIADLPEQTEDEKTVVKNGLNVNASASGDLMKDSTDVRITVDTKITNYSSQPLTGNEAHFTPIEIDPSIVITATGTQTEVGESENTYSIYWGNAREGNYVLTEDLGILTVLPIREDEITITADSDEKVYDGTALEAGGYLIVGLPDQVTALVTVSGSQTSAGTSENAIASYIFFDTDGNDITEQFVNVKKVSGTLSVTPAPLTVTTGSASKVYDGTPLTNPDATIEGLQNGETATVTATGSLTEVGTAANTYSIQWGTASSANYTVSSRLGTLEVTANHGAVTLTSGSASMVYNGTTLRSEAVTADGLPEGYTVSAVTSGGITNVGTVSNAIVSYTILNEQGEDVTSSFTNVSIVSGTLTVTPAPLTITTGSASKVYDGAPLTSSVVSIEGLQGGEAATVTATGSVTDVGTAQNTYAIDWGTASSGNYTITESLGTLEVTRASLTIRTGSASKTYDGTPLTSSEAAVEGLRGGDSVTVTPNGAITNVGSTQNTYDINWGGTDKNNYNLTEDIGTLTVTTNNARIVFTADSASKIFDGTPLTAEGVSISGVPSGFRASAVAGGSQTNVGSSANPVSSYTILDRDGNNANSNFGNIQTVSGTLDVDQCSLSFRLGGTFDYDGEMHYADLSMSADVSSSQYTLSMSSDGSGRIVFDWGDVIDLQVNYGGIEAGIYGGGSNPLTVRFSSGNSSNYSISISAGFVTITEDGTIIGGG